MTEHRAKPTILVADDDPDDRLMIEEAFEESLGECTLSFAHDGAQLMRMLNGEERWGGMTGAQQRYPDLILLDLNMPLKDGREALLEIKSNPNLKQVPTVVMTTSNNEDDILDCYNHGANSYIVKPLSFSELISVAASVKDYWIGTVNLPIRPDEND